jgi:hypothetical protein
LGYIHAANTLKQVKIYCNDRLIVESLDYVFETNILRAPFSDAIKLKYPETFSSNNAVINMNKEICDVYINPNGWVNNSTISVKYHITIPMTTFNLLARITYLSNFFGT